MIHDLPEVLSPNQLAELIGSHPNVVRRQCQSGVIPSTKVGSKWVIPRDLVFHKLIEMEEELEQ